jgi:hypothetical protein
MVSVFTPNIQLENPAFGDQVGIWDVPVDSNWTILDRVLGAVNTIPLNNANVTLASSQYQCKTIIFNSTLTGSVTITFPTSFVKGYEILNQCTGSSAFTVTLATTVAGGQVICAPVGEFHDINNTGTNIVFKSLHRVGRYWDYAGSSVPAWVSGCTVPPYLNCDGSTFSATTYPALATILGSTTLPDARGRSRFALTQTTSRITSAISGINGTVRGAAGGSESIQQHNHTINDPGHTHSHDATTTIGVAATLVGAGGTASPVPSGGTINAAVTGISVNNTGTGTTQNVPPTYIGGLTLIRGA